MNRYRRNSCCSCRSANDDAGEKDFHCHCHRRAAAAAAADVLLCVISIASSHCGRLWAGHSFIHTTAEFLHRSGHTTHTTPPISPFIDIAAAVVDL